MRFRRALAISQMSRHEVTVRLTSSILTEGALFTARMVLLLAVVVALMPCLESALNLLSIVAAVSALESTCVVSLPARVIVFPFGVILVIFPQ